jgi:hypothetical protein
MNSHEQYLIDLQKSKDINRKRKEQKEKFKKNQRKKKSRHGKKISRCHCDKCCKIRKERLNKGTPNE